MKKLFNILLIGVFLLPQVNTVYALNLLLFLFILKHRHEYFLFQKFTFLFFLITSLSFALVNPDIHYYLNNKDIFKPVLNVMIILLIGNYSRIEVNKKVLLFISVFLILSQFAYIFGIIDVIQLIDSIYPFNEEQIVWTHRSISDVNELSIVNIRGGGIYRNPNQYSKYLNLLYVLVLNVRLKAHIKYLISFAFLISILLTGSRTGLIIFILINLAQLTTKNNSRLLFIFIGIVVYAISRNFTLRSFDISSGFSSGSLIQRIPSLDYIIQDLNVKSLFIGNFYNEDTISNLLSNNFMFDSDLLSIFFSFGLMGLVILTIIYYKLLKFSKIKYIAPIFLYSITGGIVFDLNYFILINIILLLAQFQSKHEN